MCYSETLSNRVSTPQVCGVGKPSPELSGYPIPPKQEDE